jgi:phosphoglycerate dehydrogenase-like enzyme
VRIVLLPHDLILPLTTDQVERIAAACPGHELVVARDPAAVAAAVPTADVIFGDLPFDVLDLATSVRWVQSVGAGVDKIAAHLGERPVLLTGAKGVVGPQLAEHALALLLSITRGLAAAWRRPGFEHRKEIRDAQWELTDRTICIVGMGGAGRALASRARGLEFASVVGVDIDPTAGGDLLDALVPPERIDELLPDADVVVLTLPLTPANVGWFGTERFAAMKHGSILVNVARGALVQEQPLLDALRSGKLFGAGLDVTPVEPLPSGHPLWDLPNVVITPHNAGGSPRRADRVADGFRDNLVRYLAGEQLQGLHDPARGF